MFEAEETNPEIIKELRRVVEQPARLRKEARDKLLAEGKEIPFEFTEFDESTLPEWMW